MTDGPNAASGWPDLPTGERSDPIEVLHLWSQAVGKIRPGLECAPPEGPDWWRDRPRRSA